MTNVSLCLLQQGSKNNEEDSGGELQQYGWDEAIELDGRQQVAFTVGIECLSEGYMGDIWSGLKATFLHPTPFPVLLNLALPGDKGTKGMCKRMKGRKSQRRG